MTFSCFLERPSAGLRFDASKPSREVLDYEPLVMEACALLSETECRFFVGGFGQDDWRLDVAYDLSAVLEQLPSLLVGLRAGTRVELDLYSQGVERTLSFTRTGQDVVIRCRSQTSWVPNPDTEVMSSHDLESMFVRLANDFAASLELVDPDISSLPPFRDWRLGKA